MFTQLSPDFFPFERRWQWEHVQGTVATPGLASVDTGGSVHLPARVRRAPGVRQLAVEDKQGGGGGES